MPKHYMDRYLAIKNSDITTLSEEDLRILLYSILNHEKIKNNRIILIIDRLLEFPDNSLPATNYSLEEMLEEIKGLREIYPVEDKLSSNNVAACHHCLQVFFIDKIKYVNKKGYCLCPYCRNSTLYFDNDFIPMDENFLRLTKLVYDVTPLGCKFTNLQRLLKKSIKIQEKYPEEIVDTALFIKSKNSDVLLKKNHIEFHLPEIVYKKQITSKEEMNVHYIMNEYFQIVEKNIISKVIIDTSIIGRDYTLSVTLLIFLIETLGKNPYLKEINLICKDKEWKKMYKSMIEVLGKFQVQKVSSKC